MQCEDVRAALIDARYQDDELPVAVQTHLETCVACAAERASADALDAVLAVDENEPPRPGFDTRFFARLEAERRQPSERWPAWLRWGFVAAATPALAMAVFLGLRTNDPVGAIPATAEDMALVANLELLEAMPVIENLEEIEAYEVLAAIDLEELDHMLAEEETP